MTLIGKLAIIFALPIVVGTGTAAKLYGDTQWVPIGSYQQEKLYDLEDAAEVYTDREFLGELLSPLDLLNQKRLLKRINRLRNEIN